MTLRLLTITEAAEQLGRPANTGGRDTSDGDSDPGVSPAAVHDRGEKPGGGGETRPRTPKNPPGRVAHGTVLPGARPRTRAATSRSSGDDTRTPRLETDGPPQARRGASFLPPAGSGVIDDAGTPNHTQLRED